MLAYLFFMLRKFEVLCLVSSRRTHTRARGAVIESYTIQTLCTLHFLSFLYRHDNKQITAIIFAPEQVNVLFVMTGEWTCSSLLLILSCM